MINIRKKFFGSLFLALGLLVCTSSLRAEEPPKVEVFGGYSYVRAEDHNLNGWNISAAYNFNRWLGGVADFGGVYHKVGTVDVSVHTFLFGPQVSYRKHKRLTPFAHTLFGVARFKGENENITATSTDFSMVVGGGVDVKLTKHFSIRPAQVDYLLTSFGDNTQNYFRFSTGAVVRF